MFDKLNLGDMMKKAQQLQEQMSEAQKEVEKIQMVGTAGADLVKTTINGKYEVLSIEIDDSLLDDKKLLEDLVAASFTDATSRLKSKIAESQSSLFSSLPAGFKPPF